MFGKHGLHLSDVFWKALRRFSASRKQLILDPVSPEFMQPRVVPYARAVREKVYALGHCVGFIDGTLIGIERPGDDEILRSLAYNRPKRKHAMKFQGVTSPFGLALHLSGPLEGRRQLEYVCSEWTRRNFGRHSDC